MDEGTNTNSHRQWEFFADSIPLILCLVDGQGRIIRANRTVERWGLGQVSEVVAANPSLHELLHPDCKMPNCPLSEFEQEAWGSLNNGHRSHLEGFDPKLGRHVAINVQPIVENENRGLGEAKALISVDDVSELDRSEKGVLCLKSSLRLCIVQEVAKRRQSEDVQARLLTILSRTPNLIGMADANRNFFYLNEAGRKMLGLSEDASTLPSLDDCLTEEARQVLIHEALPFALAQDVWSGPATLITQDDHRIPTNQVLIAHKRPDGQPIGFSVVEQNMTAWVEAEATLRRTQEELQRLSGQLLDIQEIERRRIAADLHDVIGQSLSLIRLSIDNASKSIGQGDTAAASDVLQRLSGKVKDTLAEVQRVSMNLRPSTLDDLGILPTLSWFFREFETTCHQIRVSKEFNVKEEHIPPPLKTAIFRILQEATANIVKHAGADKIRVAITHNDDTLALIIEDNGQGFDPTSLKTASRQGLGLRSMQERARLSGGSCVLETVVGQGTRILAHWPTAVLAGIPSR
ncbi:MAG TPA: ATP-binding protein [Rhodocyclaceae bacterium]|nr:ATP-binding protein [Rhodocyclaceae bacterium]